MSEVVFMKKAAFLVVFAIAGVLAIFSYPASAACIITGGSAYSETQAELIQKARSRIEAKFGAMQARPMVYFFDQDKKYWPLKLNPYGSTSFLGYKTCIAIGPHGQNVDVVAHELMHAEIVKRAGFWVRNSKIPVWFEEGLAMQVDFRERYNLQQHQNAEFVTKLRSRHEFFTTDSKALVHNYAAAKSEVNAWLSHKDKFSVYKNLSDIKQGASFDTIWGLVE